MYKYLLGILFFCGLSVSVFAQRKGLYTVFSEQLFVDVDGGTLSLKTILEKHKGNILYVDFWASWCAPCRREMPYSLRIAHKFKNLPIKFIYLSLDDTDNAWLASMEQLGITTNGYHYRRPFKDANELLQALYIYSIPHYAIFDKEGKPLELNAPAPSQRSLEKMLRKYAKTAIN